MDPNFNPAVEINTYTRALALHMHVRAGMHHTTFMTFFQQNTVQNASDANYLSRALNSCRMRTCCPGACSKQHCEAL